MSWFGLRKEQKERTEQLLERLKQDRHLRHDLKARIAALQIEAEVLSRRKHT